MSTLLASGHVLIGAKIGPALAGMAKVQSQFTGTAKGMTRTGALITKGVGLPIAAAFGLSIKAAADFESALNDMQAVSGATDRQMKAVSKTAKQLGSDASLPATSAKDAAEAMVQLAKGGMTANQAMKAARGTLQLSAAAGIENAQAAEIQADALNAFGLQASQAGRVADILAASANVSTAEITDMAASLQQSSAVAKQAGLSIEETATALTFLANAGIKGSDAGTSLKTMLLRLQAPIGSGAKTIKEYGISLRDASGELKPLPALANEFRDKLGGLGKAQRDAAMAAIFGTDAIRAANILLSKSSDQYAKQTAAVSKAGAAQQLAAAKMKGFNGALERFKSSVETAAISIGTILLPIATKIVNALSRMAGAFESLSPSAQRAVVTLLSVAAVAGPLILIAGKLAIALRAVGVAMIFATGPVGVAIVAIAALVAGLIYAYQHSQTFRNIVNRSFAAVKSVVVPVVASISAAVATMVAFFRRHWAEISATVTAAMSRIRTVVQAGLTVIRALWSTFGGAIVAFVRSSWTVISTVIRTAMLVIGNIIRAVMAAIRGDWSGAWSALRAAATAAIQGAAATVRAILSGLVSTAGALARGIGRSIVNGIKGALAAIRSIYAVMWSGISGAISSAAGAALGAARSIGSAIVSGALAGVGGLAGALRSKVQGAISSALSNLNPFSPVEHGGKKYIGDPIVNGAVKAVEQGKKKLKLAITNTVRDAINSARGNAMSLASSLAGTIGQGLDALLGRKLATLGNSPAAQRIKQIEDQQRAESSARERARLDAAIANAETAADRQAAVQDLNDWLLEQERQALADQLALEEQKLRDETDAKKTAAERNLANLTDAFNRGLISQQQFNEGLQKILADSEMSYEVLGDLLGGAVARGFQDQWRALQDQIADLARWAGVPFGVGDLKVEDPFQVQLREWTNRRKTLVNNLENARKAATKSTSPGGTKITADEAKTIAARQQALDDWDRMKPRRAALGGIIRGGGVTDSVPLLAKPGEGVLSHRGMDSLIDMAMGRGRGGTKIEFNVQFGTVIGAGSPREAAREMARLVLPEIERRVRLAA